MNSITIPILVTAFVVQVLVTYLLVKFAVADATKEILFQLKLQNNLRLLSFKREGVPENEVRSAIEQSKN
ncbi:MAG: hypothetical protein EOO53_20155 [Gammaproteobacteria bacterium]|nr:MAG: hypothetical protein EOO53_20155 [Gammaproteobacteria bacterium]